MGGGGTGGGGKGHLTYVRPCNSRSAPKLSFRTLHTYYTFFFSVEVRSLSLFSSPRALPPSVKTAVDTSTMILVADAADADAVAPAAVVPVLSLHLSSRAEAPLPSAPISPMTLHKRLPSFQADAALGEGGVLGLIAVALVIFVIDRDATMMKVAQREGARGVFALLTRANAFIRGE